MTPNGRIAPLGENIQVRFRDHGVEIHQLHDFPLRCEKRKEPLPPHETRIRKKTNEI